jgi:eukaryotic-like serine/threonine-protein kinase
MFIGSDNIGSQGGVTGAAGRLIDGKYRLEEWLGAGGMGTVYRATRLLIGDAVAVKILHPALVSDEQAAERFRREAQAAARLKHPNAVNVYDFGLTPDGTLYLVMELVEGESLRQLIKSRGVLGQKAACEIARQVCAALDEAHHRHIVHRDIKPDNIIVHETPKGVRVKVLDFGVAKLRDVPATTLTQTGSVVGTPHYMSPEQCLGEEIDHRSDIYSVGIVLYEMLCGTVPFNSPISTAVIVQHVNQPPPPLREKNGAVTPGLERAVLRALEKNREARPQTAGALAEEVEAALSGRARSEEFTWDAASVEAATADSTRPRAPLDEGESTAARAAGATPRSEGSGAQLTPTEVLLKPAYVSSPLRPTTARAGRATEGAGSSGRLRRTLLLSAAALVVVAAFGRLAVWMSPGKGSATRSGNSGEASVNRSPSTAQNAGGSEAKSSRGPHDSSSPSPQQASAGMAYVRADVFVMGRDGGDEYESPPHRIGLGGSFYIDKYEVTCEEYARFLKGADYKRFPIGWHDDSCAPGSERMPVTGVTWDDAAAYARWAGKRLPTEEEWEFAARGKDGRLYPWGDEWRAGFANADDEGKSRGGVEEVGKYAEGATPSGIFDMSGNVWEWTASKFIPYQGGQARPAVAGDNRVVRGGSWESTRQWATTTYRGYWPHDTAKPTVGFRCAKDAAQ